MTGRLLGQLAGSVGAMSLIAIGGANAIVPELHRQTVQHFGWLTDQQFANLYALAQVAPGPNVLVVSLIGWQVAGLPGLLVATAAMIGPASLLAFLAHRLIGRLQGAAWLQVVQAGLIPVALGLILSSGSVMARAADHGGLTITITTLAAGFVLFTDRNPLWALGGGVAAALVFGQF